MNHRHSIIIVLTETIIFGRTLKNINWINNSVTLITLCAVIVYSAHSVLSETDECESGNILLRLLVVVLFAKVCKD